MAKNREHKSDAFSMLMENKRYALDVYNALNQSKYTDPESIQVERLEGAISLSMRNDASFIIDGRLNLYEHQSTYNPNMPLRSMVYYANIMEKWIKKNKCDLYGSKRIKIPVPYFVVFYNGLEPRPEQEEMRLSEAFIHETANPQLELLCKVYNINSGYHCTPYFGRVFQGKKG